MEVDEAVSTYVKTAKKYLASQDSMLLTAFRKPQELPYVKDRDKLVYTRSMLIAHPPNTEPCLPTMPRGKHFIEEGDCKLVMEYHGIGLKLVDLKWIHGQGAKKALKLIEGLAECLPIEIMHLLESVEHWGGVQVRVCLDFDTTKSTAAYLGSDGKPADTSNQSLYAYIDTRGVLDSKQGKGVGGGKTPLPSKLGDIMDIPGNLSAGLPYTLKIFVGTEDNHHIQMLTKLEFHCKGGPSHREIFDLTSIQVELRKDGKLQYLDHVYDSPTDLMKHKPDKKNQSVPPEQTKTYQMLLLIQNKDIWPPMPNPGGGQDENMTPHKVKDIPKRIYEVSTHIKDLQGYPATDPRHDPWTTEEREYVIDDIAKELGPPKNSNLA